MYNSNQNYKVNLLQTYIFRTYGRTDPNNRKTSLLKRIIMSISSAVISNQKYRFVMEEGRGT